MPRVRAFVPWLVVAVVIAAGVCALAWPVLTGWVVGGVVGTVALVAGVRMLLEEQRTPRDCPACDAGAPHTEHCPTPETHNWGCGRPGDQARKEDSQ